MDNATPMRLSGAAEDWMALQTWGAFMPEDHATWDRLFERQSRSLPGRVAPEFLKGGQRAAKAGAIGRLSCIYWYTVEFGLICADDGLKLYGAWIISSHTESVFAIDDPSPNRLPFDFKSVMRTRYRIDDFMQDYFEIDAFDDLLNQTLNTDLNPIYGELVFEPDIKTETILPTDVVYRRGTQCYARSKVTA